MYPTEKARYARLTLRLTLFLLVRRPFRRLMPLILLGMSTAFAQVPVDLSVEGEVQVLAVDELDESTGQWRHRLEYFLQTERERLHIQTDEASLHALRPNSRIRVVGVRPGTDLRIGDIAVLDSFPQAFASGPQASVTTGPQSTLVALLNFKDLTIQPLMTGEIQKRLVLNPDSTDRFLRENSYGKVWLDADVLDWKTMGISYTEIGEGWSLNSTKLLDEALKLLDPLVNLHDYARLILIFPHLPLGGLSGMGTLGNWTINTPQEGQWTTSVVWMDADWALSSVFAHQLGHNLGFRHASSIVGLGENILDPTCPLGVWGGAGDIGDVMGGSSYFQHFSTIWKSQALWLPESSIQTVTASGQYLVEQLERASNGAKAIKIPLGVNGSGNPIGYWIEYRKPADDFGTSDAVQVRLFSNSLFDGSSASQDSIRFESLELPGGIQGTVTGDQGEGIAGVWVEAYDSNGHYLSSAETDSAGDYVMVGTLAGTVFLKTNNSTGYVDEYYDNAFTSSSAKPVTVTAGAFTTGINFHLTAGGFISGRVVRDSDGKPLPNAPMYASSSDGEYQKSATTNASGQYSLSGLRPGSFYLRTNQRGEYVDEYYRDARFKDQATLVPVAAGEHKANIDISLALGGVISGRVTGDSDGKGVEGVWIDTYDLQGRYLDIYVRTDSSGFYSLKGVPAGSCVLYASRSGYRGEYYDNVTVRTQAKPVLVTAGTETPGINFGLARSSSSSVEAPGRISIEADGWQPGTMNLLRLSGDGTTRPDSLHRFSDILPGQAFVDPYRGVKVELVEKTGSGAGAAALLRIGLSGLQTDCGAALSFGQVRIGSHADRTITVKNTSAANITLGHGSVAGRNAANFVVTQDGCSGKILGASQTCSVVLSFAPQALSSTSFAGEFAVLRIPSNDILRPTGAVSLSGIAEGVDLTITNARLADFRAGQAATYRLQVKNQGTVSTAAPIMVVDQLPPGLSFVSQSSASFKCSGQGQTVTCTSASLSLCPLYCAAIIDLTVEVDPGVRALVVNSASVTSTEDMNAANNTAEDRADLRLIRQKTPSRP
ncbi:MAG: DUF11 domain-containing protein [Acidobacteria bacterium]|nr:MAG: DUF11 domain-containing protein [Acidobacteriota bacterium]